jgi:hypothetical protein
MTLLSQIAIIGMLIILSPAAHAQTVTENRLITLCQQRLVDHVPDANAEYQPGVDVDGNAVAPADIGTTLDTGIYPLRIPLEMDILERFNLDLPEGIIADANVADIMVHEDGRMTYNGQDISAQLEALCVENEIIVSPETQQVRPEIETAPPPKPSTTTSDGQIEIEPLAPSQEDEIIKGEYH